MTVAAFASRPKRFAGIPLGTWGFALRNWAAMMLALYVAFWLQLESASSAATCVAILSLQTRGQALQKAVYRMGGTVLGVIVSIAIAGVFSQTRDLFFLACAVWLGLCAMAASMLDGNRAYGAVLSGYTVAIVAVPNVDTPLQTFSSGVNRGAAIVIGILAMAFISDVFGAPDLLPSVLKRLEGAQRKVKAFVAQAIRQGSAAPADAAALMKEITALHPDITALPSESLRGHARAEAARTAASSLLREISAARVISASLAALGPVGDEPRQNLIHAIEGQPHVSPQDRALAVIDDPSAPHYRLIAAAACLVLFEQDRMAGDAIAAMRENRMPGRRARLKLYKPWSAAVRNGLRAFVAMSLAAVVLSLTGWPASVTALVQIGSFIGLSATNPNPRGFAVGALMA
ncbi:MAG: FUSC family protein, partial [Caulobacteraceae bacterium]|nr:FUSC family protein [Caulobacter sp.]